MLQVWLLQWGTEQQLKRWRESGVMHMTAGRLEENMSKIYDMGFEDGRLQGRVDFRLDIDEGRIIVERGYDDKPVVRSGRDEE
jgi:hypothetical protein